MRFYKNFYILVYFLFFCTSVHTTSHYVDKNANGHNNGTSWINAWKSFSDIDWSQIQSGDVLYISGGTDSTIYYEEMVVWDIQGTAANPITIRNSLDAGHNGRVIIDAQYPTRLTCITVNGDYGPSVDYVTLKGFECRNARTGIHIEDYARNIIVDSMTITDWYDLAAVFANGVVTADSLPNGIDSITIRNSTMISFVNDGVQTDGIYVAGATNTVIHDNYIWIRNQHPMAHVDGIQSMNTDGFVIYNNVIINDAVYSPEGGGMPIILRAADDEPVIIYNNFLYMGGVWMNGANWGIVLNTHSGDKARSHQPPTYILHNTVVGNGPQLVGVEFGYFGENTDGVFINNIVAQFGDGVGPINWLATISNSAIGGDGIDVDNIRNNLFWREWGDVNFAGSWTNGIITDNNFGWTYWTSTLGGAGVNANPLFLDSNIGTFGSPPLPAYQDQGALRGYLQSGSPAINQGEDLQALIESMGLPWTDINGIPRDNTPDIGAYQYVP